MTSLPLARTIRTRDAAARRPATFFALLLVTACAAPAAFAASLEIDVDGVGSAEGSLRVAVYDSAERFMKDAVKARTVEASPGTASLRFDGLAPGDYAVAVHHDVNANGRVDTNLVGLPTEPTGFSGSPSRFAPPSWVQVRFGLTEPGTKVRIRLGR